MNERPSAGSGVVGYVIVLVGVAGFVLSCFLPYTTFGVVVGGGSPASSTFSFYRLITRNTPGGGTLQYVGGLLFLFGGAATVAWVALAGLRHGHHERRRTPSILVAVTVAWVVELDRPARQRVGVLRRRSWFLVHARQRRCGHRRHDRRLGLYKTDGARAGLRSRSRTADGRPSRLVRRLAVRRRLPVRLMADQLLVRTGEMARRQAGGPNPVGNEGHRKILGAVARYVPAFSGMRLL